MDICILKSASRPQYFKQNLKILRLQKGQEITLNYRTLWVDDELVDIFQMERHHIATVAYCDLPGLTCIPFRQLEVYNIDVTDGLVTLFGRCGNFVDPDESLNWAKTYRENNPTAGNPKAGNPPGKFVTPLVNQKKCPLADDDRQLIAWKSVIDEMVKQDTYADCFFFQNLGVKNEQGEEADPDNFIIGEKYFLNVLSYNKHLPKDTLANTQLQIIADESTVGASSETTTVSGLKDFNIELIPASEGVARVELSVAGLGVKTSKIKLDIKCREFTPENTSFTPAIAVGREQEDANWQCYLVARRLCPGNNTLLRELLTKCFSDEEQATPRIAQEIAIALYESGEYAKCAELCDSLAESTLANLSENAREAIALSYCWTRHKFPAITAFSNLDFMDDELLGRFQTLLDNLEPPNAASVLLSIVSDYANVLIDEHDLGDLLTESHAATSFNRLQDIMQIAQWLRDYVSPMKCYNFLIDKLNTSKQMNDIMLLELCVDVGRECDANKLSRVVTTLIYRLLETNQLDKAIESMDYYIQYVSVDDRAYMLESIAEQTKDENSKIDYRLKAADLFRKILNFHSAKRNIYSAQDINKNLGNTEIDEEMEIMLSEILDAEALYGEDDEFDKALSTAKIACRNKRIAIIGGYKELQLNNRLRSELDCDIDWYPSSMETHVGHSQGLQEGVRKGETCLILQMRFSSHGDTYQIKKVCDTVGVPVVFCYGTHWKSAVRAIARQLSVEVAKRKQV